MKITCIHPTRERSYQASLNAQKWINNAYSDIEYIVSVDKNDISDYSWTKFAYNNCTAKLIFNYNKSAIDAINNAAKIAIGDIFIVVSDDTDCPINWDISLLEALKDKSDFLVKTRDGLQPTLITLPIMDRTYYNRFGYIYHPDYQHMFCDQEMTAVGHMLGKVITLDLTFEHLHYTTGKSPKDAINRKNDATWAQGEALFNERLKTNFGIESPVIPYTEIKWR